MTLDTIERGLPRSYLRAVLLVLVTTAPAHGYELLEQVSDIGLRSVDTGGLYRTLRGMEREGLVASWWENSSSGPPRRTYALTPAGRDAMATEMAAIRSTVELLSELADRAERVIGPR